MAMTLTGYTIATSGPQSDRFHTYLLGLGALLSEPSRPVLLRLVVQRHVHAVAFASAQPLAALLTHASRTGLQAHVLTAFASDVIAAGAPEVMSLLSQRGLPVVIGRPARPLLEHALAAALWAQRLEFTAGRLRFVLQGNALLVDGRVIALDPPLATVLRALASNRGAPVPRSTLARLSVRRVEQTVSQLRTALGERSWLIATVSRRGYRLAVEGVTTS